ncbi:MAG: type III-B CRISPR-associated protein Cas10/Cmr2 [Magnetococcus sp. WYHC-3]
MKEFAFWQQKIIQFFHDPPGKPFTGTKGKAHVAIANALFDAFQKFNEDEKKWRLIYKSADWAATGADRPMLYVPKVKGKSGLGRVYWHKQPEITHPLAPGYRLRLDGNAGLPEKEDPFEEGNGQPRDLLEEDDPSEDGNGQPRDILVEELDVAGRMASYIPDWKNSELLRKGFVILWRRFRDELMAANPHDPLWQELPADSRCPDHAIWDHLKVTTALAFMKHHKPNIEPKNEGAQEPWMLRVSVGPIGDFINQSRTSRDLWMGSYLLADLTWAAMLPVVRRYGPDCIVYPDLCANPRVDCWLHEEHREALYEEKANPATFASLIPSAFVALVPRGGVDHLLSIETLAQECRDSMAKRWQELAHVVEQWMAQIQPDLSWKTIWQRQHRQPPLQLTWMAIPWQPMGRIKNVDSLTGGPALPASKNDPARDAGDLAVIDARRQRLAPWVPQNVWHHYERVRQVFARSCLDLHQMERGFDYALTHHQLSARHALRKGTDYLPLPDDGEPGEKCTLCGQRQALHTGNTQAGLGAARQQAKEFWKHKKLDPDQTGEERLCAVCAVRRFLVKADAGMPLPFVFNNLWAGMASPETMRDNDNEMRVPFPAAATIAAQAFIAQVAGDMNFRDAIDGVVHACGQAELPRTSFPRALPRLAALNNSGPDVNPVFLEYEAQSTLFPETIDGLIEGRKRDRKDPTALEELKKAVKNLRRQASEKKIPPPQTRIAVITLDGDRMGRLLVGDQAVVASSWQDVLHPTTLQRLQKNEHLLESGWADLLPSKRLMGPSVHAFISRAMANFSHRLVPWVVEMEFSGRLIYAGGDDVLCLAPADEALALAARLQQLFSAVWVIDTKPETLPWSWQRNNKETHLAYDPEKARRRFVIPLPLSDDKYAPQPIQLSEDGHLVARHVAEEEQKPYPPTAALRGKLLPMLGSGASLSAGIAIGHYKTPLSQLLKRSRDLQDYAKEPFKHGTIPDGPSWSGRRALAVGHASRGGTKTGFALPWNDESASAHDGPSAHRHMQRIIDAFREGKLPGRLPYKLRALTPTLKGALEELSTLEDRNRSDLSKRQLLEDLFASCLEGDMETELRTSALKLWQRGIDLHRENLARAVDGLLVCRELSRDDGEEEQV